MGVSRFRIWNRVRDQYDGPILTIPIRGWRDNVWSERENSWELGGARVPQRASADANALSVFRVEWVVVVMVVVGGGGWWCDPFVRKIHESNCILLPL
jgi:hypothetical protein